MSKSPPPVVHDERDDKATLEAKPNEARMSEIAKRLLATPPTRASEKKFNKTK